jgi:hypothetical protein
MPIEKIFTFWEGIVPEYLKLCLDTWKFPFVILNYDNLSQYTDKIPEKVKNLTLPKIADYVRVHVLRDNGGYWLDTDTILLSDNLPSETILGENESRMNTIGFLHTEANSDMFIQWAKYQDNALSSLPESMSVDTTSWDFLGNSFTNSYLKTNTSIKIGNIYNCWPETTVIDGSLTRASKYVKLYFDENYDISKIPQTNMLMLHNSWTPSWYKKLSREEVLNKNCTLSNILRSVL